MSNRGEGAKQSEGAKQAEGAKQVEGAKQDDIVCELQRINLLSGRMRDFRLAAPISYVKFSDIMKNIKGNGRI